MPADPPALPTPPLDRAALERVLARAAELQGTGAEPSEQLTEQQIVELGAEVGLSARHLRQAMAEERTRVAVPEEHGIAARLMGPAHAAASRTVAGQPAGVLSAVDGWMQREECLRVKRRFPDRIVWETGSGVMTNISRWLNLGGRGYHLRRAHEVAATAVAIGDDRVFVQLDADLSNIRANQIQAGTTTALAGGFVSGTLAVLGVMIPVAVVPVVVIGGAAAYFSRGTHRRMVSSAQLALEQMLDRLEQGEHRPSATVPRLLDVALDVTRRLR